MKSVILWASLVLVPVIPAAMGFVGRAGGCCDCGRCAADCSPGNCTCDDCGCACSGDCCRPAAVKAEGSCASACCAK